MSALTVFGMSAPTDAGTPYTGWLFLFALAVLYGIGYAISIRLHPYKPCRTCKGSGKHRGWLFEHAFRACDRCHGSGRELRLFARDN